MKYSADGEPVTLPPGSFVSVPAGNPMWAWTGDDPVEIQVHGTGPFSTTSVE
jgi:quercetin dioxygenase-like cupin family protein